MWGEGGLSEQWAVRETKSLSQAGVRILRGALECAILSDGIEEEAVGSVEISEGIGSGATEMGGPEGAVRSDGCSVLGSTKGSPELEVGCAEGSPETEVGCAGGSPETEVGCAGGSSELGRARVDRAPEAEVG
ncbi:hypothetical protein CRG98_006768 [Punica granatum]|uniref:Uncharacterized protein n=1 Tax=Punica granatum TaxID=22663 RepID=A0A2I0KWW5_PUNGR|nr:hypothetical protein CRG98_006768 [Punica granatum]